MFGRFRKTPPAFVPALERITNEAHARTRVGTEARIAELRATRHHKVLLNIMETVIRDGITYSGNHKETGAG